MDKSDKMLTEKATEKKRPMAIEKRFSGLNIALPESRQLDVLANLFIKRGASLLRCPLVSIIDSPNTVLIENWLKDFINTPPDIFIVLTGEGIKRLSSFAEKSGLLEEWSQALTKVHIVARGPKPNRALKLLDLEADELALEPTTDGMIKTLEAKKLSGLRISVQLYGEDPNKKLQNYLDKRKVSYNLVAPYVYASDVDTENVVDLIEKLADNKFDLICFTSKAQYHRLEAVAKKFDLVEMLKKGLQQTKIVAIGPVVAEQLTADGHEIAAMPEEKYFMKPMVSAIEELLCQ